MGVGELTSRGAVLQAIAEYDRVGREEFLNRYGFGGSTRYQLIHEGRRYESKAIAGAAFGVQFPERGPLRSEEFNGGVQTTGPLERLGFEIAPTAEADAWSLTPAATQSSISPVIEEALSTYTQAKTEPFGGEHATFQLFAELADLFSASQPVSTRPTVKPKASVGQGNWARVPWVAFLDSRETQSTRSGVYPVLLFREDMSGTYLTLAQGVTEPKKLGALEAARFLETTAEEVRKHTGRLQAEGFIIDSQVFLSTNPGLGKDYEASVIAHKLYERGAVPNDAELIDDLEAVLEATDRYLEGASMPSDLQELVDRFRAELPYPRESDKTHIAARDELAELFSEENLSSIEADPSRLDRSTGSTFNRFVGHNYGGPGNQSQIQIGLDRDGPDGARQLARSLDYLIRGEGASQAERIDSVNKDSNWAVFGLKENLITKALAVVFPEEWLPVFNYEGDMGKKSLSASAELGIEPPSKDEFPAVGARAVESNRRLRERLEPLLPGDPWGQMQFLYWLRDQHRVEIKPVGLDALADELLLDHGWLAEAVDLLRDKRQIIFYGPPGTGKTYVARRLAEHIAQDPARSSVVQFHPSYAYEDFIQGYRPVPGREDGSVSFKLQPGPLMRMALAAQESSADWCMLIDEINRGNIAKVFGELYYLLEYRDDEIELQYGDDFRMPKNLYLIGTMNTADRSIALLDAALRRRFHFIPFFPDQPPIDDLLDRWLARHKPAMSYVGDLVRRANAMLPDRHLQIGPSHFMTPRLDGSWLEKIWRRSVIPYIEEQFFDEPERVKAFALDQLLNAGNGEQSGEPTEEVALEPETDPASGVETNPG